MVRVHLADTTTDKHGWYEMEWSETLDQHALEFIFENGNYSCDCNRAMFLARALSEDEPEFPPCGRGRYRIIGFTYNGKDIPYLVWK